MQQCEIRYSCVIKAPAQKIWTPFLEDFPALIKILPPIESCNIINGKGASEIGAIREITFVGGKKLWEELLALDRPNMTQVYSILPYNTDGRPSAADASPFPGAADLVNYVATARVRSVVEDDTSFVEWSSSFDVALEVADAVTRFIQNGVFKGGLAALAQKLDA